MLIIKEERAGLVGTTFYFWNYSLQYRTRRVLRRAFSGTKIPDFRSRSHHFIRSESASPLGRPPKLEYPTSEQIIRTNRTVLIKIKKTKGDAHKVLSREKITKSISEAILDQGDIYDKAATLLTELTRGRPFASGNRRTAVAVTQLFLKSNGARVSVLHDDKVMMGIREGFYKKSEIREWLKGNVIRPFHRWFKIRFAAGWDNLR